MARLCLFPSINLLFHHRHKPKNWCNLPAHLSSHLLHLAFPPLLVIFLVSLWILQARELSFPQILFNLNALLFLPKRFMKEKTTSSTRRYTYPVRGVERLFSSIKTEFLPSTYHHSRLSLMETIFMGIHLWDYDYVLTQHMYCRFVITSLLFWSLVNRWTNDRNQIQSSFGSHSKRQTHT